MDPISQGVLGAAFSQCFAKKDTIKVATVCGAIGGLAADIDVLIKSSHDSLLSIEYHRHFTHSIFFIPFGGFLTAIFLWYLLYKNKFSFYTIFLFATLGYATHGLLDSCTSYGTTLYWPFSDYRVTLNIVSIIDLLFTIPLLIFCLLAFFKQSYKFAIIGMIVSMSYLSLGLYNNIKVSNFVYKLAEKRNHTVDRIFLNPTFGNIILWRAIYQSGNTYYVDSIRVPAFKETQYRSGELIDVINEDTVFPELGKDSVQRKDIKRFSHFTKGFIYIHKDYKNIIADLRYGTLPYDSQSLWGIIIDPKNPDKHVKFVGLRNINHTKIEKFLLMVKGADFD